MTSHVASTVKPTPTSERSLRMSSPRRRSPRTNGLASIGRFLSLAIHPARAGAVGGSLTVLLVGGAWAGVTWFLLPATRRVQVHTPFGIHTVTVAVSRLPFAITSASVLCASLFLIAGIRLQMMRDRHGADERADLA